MRKVTAIDAERRAAETEWHERQSMRALIQGSQHGMAVTVSISSGEIGLLKRLIAEDLAVLLDGSNCWSKIHDRPSASTGGRGAMRKLWKFCWDCGRMGTVTGVFVADDEEVRSAFGRQVDFGEILGKHSEICGPLEQNDITELPATDEQLDWLVAVFDAKVAQWLDVPSQSMTIIGHNPLQNLREDEPEAQE